MTGTSICGYGSNCITTAIFANTGRGPRAAGACKATAKTEDHCVVWNSALLDNIDLDAIPGAGQGTWTDTTVHETFTTGSSGGALPDAGVFFIHFSAPLTLYVTYS